MFSCTFFFFFFLNFVDQGPFGLNALMIFLLELTIYLNTSHLNAEQHGLDRIYFGGCFIRGKPFPTFFFNPYDFHCFPFFGGVGESFIHKPFNFFFAGCWCLFLGRARTCGYSLDFIVCD